MKKLLVLLTVLGAAAITQAGVISPGSGPNSGTVTVNNDGVQVGLTLASGPEFIGGTGLHYSLVSRIWSGETGNPYGGLTFEYEITVLPASTADLQSGSIISYTLAPAPVDAGFTVNPSLGTESDWAANGSRIHIGTDLPIGSTTKYWVHTSTPNYAAGLFAPTFSQGIATYVPVAVPEPHEYALLAGLGLLGLAAYRRIRA